MVDPKLVDEGGYSLVEDYQEHITKAISISSIIRLSDLLNENTPPGSLERLSDTHQAS